MSTLGLEKIRFSITRLKLELTEIRSGREFAWKDKILDYEIETPMGGFQPLRHLKLKR